MQTIQELPHCVDQIHKVLAQRILLPLNPTVQYTPDYEPAFAIRNLINFKVRNDLRLAISALDDEQLLVVIRGVRLTLTDEQRVTGWDVQAAYFELIPVVSGPRRWIAA